MQFRKICFDFAEQEHGGMLMCAMSRGELRKKSLKRCWIMLKKTNL